MIDEKKVVMWAMLAAGAVMVGAVGYLLFTETLPYFAWFWSASSGPQRAVELATSALIVLVALYVFRSLRDVRDNNRRSGRGR